MSQPPKELGSTGLVCGSLFTSALVERLKRVGVAKRPLIDPDGDDELTLEQEILHEEFQKTVYDYLVRNVDRRDHEDGLKLGVTGEREMEYGDMRSEEKAERAKPEDLEISSSMSCRRENSGSNGGIDRVLISRVCCLGAEYLNSYKGFDDTANDGGLHNRIRRIQSGEETRIDEIEYAYRRLDYRMTQMSTADNYLRVMDIPAPKGQLCCEYSTKKIIEEVRKDKYSMIKRLILDRKVLFPRPVESQGRPFYKGMDYLIAAFHYANTSKFDVVKKLDALIVTLDNTLEQEKDMVKRDPEVASKRRKLFQSFGIALGNISPSKRRSRGLSLAGGA